MRCTDPTATVAPAAVDAGCAVQDDALFVHINAIKPKIARPTS